MSRKPWYEPDKLNISYWENTTGDIGFEFTDVIDFDGAEFRMICKDQNGQVVFRKDTANANEIEVDVPNRTVWILMQVEDTLGHDGLTHDYQVDMYKSVAGEENKMLYGKFGINIDLKQDD